MLNARYSRAGPITVDLVGLRPANERRWESINSIGRKLRPSWAQSMWATHDGAGAPSYLPSLASTRAGPGQPSSKWEARAVRRVSTSCPRLALGAGALSLDERLSKGGGS
jgi:hypothetical protein